MTDMAINPKEEVVKEKEQGTPFTTKDRWEVLALLTFGHVPDKVERITCEGGPTIRLFTFPATSLELWTQYKHGKKLPVADIRDVKRAEEIFKGFIRE